MDRAFASIHELPRRGLLGNRATASRSARKLALGLLLRGRDGSNLLHHAQSIPVRPLLDDLVLFDAVDSDPCGGYLIARGSGPHQFALVGTLRYPASDNLVPF